MSGIESALSFLKNYDFLNLGWSSVELAILYGIVVLVVLAVLVLIIVKCCKSGSKRQELSENETAEAAEILSIKADENANYENLEYSSTEQNAATATFTNKVSGASIKFTATKGLTGRELKDKEFEFKEAGGVVFASEIFLTGLYVEIFLI